MNQLDWLLIALCAAAFCGIVVNTKKASAHDPRTHLADALSEAKSDAYGRCCSGDDYMYVRVQDWETTETGYRVRIGGKWLNAGRNVKVNNMTNPDGEAKVWVFGDGETTYIRCFLPGTLS